MKIDYSRNFLKQYAKLPKKLQIQTDERLLLWQSNPSNPVLRDHALSGRYQGYRSINITGDVRALYTTHGDSIVIFGFVGSHSQLY